MEAHPLQVELFWRMVRMSLCNPKSTTWQATNCQFIYLHLAMLSAHYASLNVDVGFRTATRQQQIETCECSFASCKWIEYTVMIWEGLGITTWSRDKYAKFSCNSDPHSELRWFRHSWKSRAEVLLSWVEDCRCSRNIVLLADAFSCFLTIEIAMSSTSIFKHFTIEQASTYCIV